jgi:hypothetical protein
MSQRTGQFYVTSVSSATVVLSPLTTPSQAGLGIQQITLTTTEATADPTFWGATGTCATHFVSIQKLQ